MQQATKIGKTVLAHCDESDELLRQILREIRSMREMLYMQQLPEEQLSLKASFCRRLQKSIDDAKQGRVKVVESLMDI